MEQHVAMTQQFLRTFHIQDDAGFQTGRNAKRNLGRNICLDQARDNIGRRSLCRDDQMDAGCTRQLCQTDDQAFDFFRSCQHKVGELIDHDDDLLHPFRAGLLFTDQATVKFVVITLDIVHAGHLHPHVTVIHFIHDPAQRTDCLTRIGHDFFHHVRNPVKSVELDFFRVDNDQADFRRFCPEQNGHDQRLGKDGFTGTSRTTDQKVWHCINIGSHNIAADIDSCCHGDLGRMLHQCLVLQQIAHQYLLRALIRDLNTDGCASRDRCFDPNVRNGQIEFQIIGKRSEFIDTDTHFRLQFKPGHRRTGLHIDDFGIGTILIQHHFQVCCHTVQFGL